MQKQIILSKSSCDSYPAHPDVVNDSGVLAATGLSLNKMENISLKCLATAVIPNHQIPYAGHRYS